MLSEEMTEGRSRIVGNALSLALSGAAGMVFTLIQLGILSRVLEGDLFGLFAALRGFSLLLSTLVLFGFSNALIRFVPSFQSRGEAGRIFRLYMWSSAVVLALSIALYAGRGFWSGLIPGGASNLLEPGVASWVAVASSAMAFKLLLYGGFNGLREMRFQMMLELAYLVLLTAAIVMSGDSLDILLLFKLIFYMNAAVFVLGTPIFIRMARGSRVEAGERARGDVVTPAFLPYLGSSILLSIVALAFTDFDRFVMTSVLSFSAISLFHIASRVNSVIKRFLGFPVIALQPEVTRIYEEGRWSELGGKIVLFTKVSLIGSLLLAGWAALAGREIILLLAGAKYSGAYGILLILLVGVPIAAYIAPLLSTMKALHYMKWAVLCDFLWMAVYFGTFFAFVSLWGVAGMAVAQIAASVSQMTAAVLLSRREGFYQGIGKGTGWIVLAFAAAVPAGVAASREWGIPAAAAGVVLLPLLLRVLIVRLDVFESGEAASVLKMMPIGAGKRMLAWMLGAQG